MRGRAAVEHLPAAQSLRILGDRGDEPIVHQGFVQRPLPPGFVARLVGLRRKVRAVCELARARRRAHDRFRGAGPSDTPPSLLAQCHARASGGWLLLTREAIGGPGRAVGGVAERIMRSRMVVVYRASPALACIIGARREWTVEMISSEEIPCR